MKIIIETDAEKTIRMMEESLANYKRMLGIQVFRALTVVEAEIKRQLRGPSGLKRRTGRLLNTWGENKKVTETSDSVVGEMSSAGVPYAAIHEYGGTIKAKNKKLTFPTEENRRADGSPKMTLAEAFNSKSRFITKGGLMLAGANKDNMKPVFIFKDSVTIPARPYVRPALAASQDTILKNFGLFISAAFAPRKGS